MSRQVAAVLAVPGDLSASTGGYHYDRSLLAALQEDGREATHLPLPGGFPFPDAKEMAEAAEALRKVPEDRTLIIDGLAFGALDTAVLDRVRASMIALVHHPLAHESDLPERVASRLRDLERANLAKAAHVLVPSPHIQDVLVEDYGVLRSDISVVRPGRPASSWRAGRVRRAGPPLILSVGLLHPRKGHDILIDALAQLTQPEWRAVIVGSPWAEGYKEALEDRIETSGLGGRVRLAGRVTEPELEALYEEADLFALATRYEGYGIVFDEALVRGLPIVATTAGAVPGTVPRDAGRLVAPDDASAFAEALDNVLTDVAARTAMARAATEAAATLPSWEDAARAVGAILDRSGRAGGEHG